jgi:hypothetical protein
MASSPSSTTGPESLITQVQQPSSSNSFPAGIIASVPEPHYGNLSHSIALPTFLFDFMK